MRIVKKAGADSSYILKTIEDVFIYLSLISLIR